jgi:hypothetical protein
MVRSSTLARGETGEVEVSIDSTGHEGRLTGTVRIVVADPFRRTVVLTVNSSVDREFVIENRLIDFGRIPPNTSAWREIKIPLKRAEYAVLGARSTDSNFDAYARAAAPWWSCHDSGDN